MSNRSDEFFLNDIIESIEAIESFLENYSYEQFIKDRKTFSAVVRELEVIGEASGNISDNTKNTYQDVLWRDIKDFRNKLIHGYFGIDSKILWNIVMNDLPRLKEIVIKIINNKY